MTTLRLTRRRTLALAAAGGIGFAGCARPFLGSAAAGAAGRRVALLDPAVPGPGRAVAAETQRALRAHGYQVDLLPWERAAEPGRLDTGRYRTLVLPDARAVPVPGIPAFLRFLLPTDGAPPGNLIALGGPFLSAPMQPSGHTWVTAAQAQLQAAQSSTAVISTAPSRWAGAGATVSDRPRFAGQPRDFTLSIPSLTNWGSGQIPVQAPAFASGHTLTRFAARGLGGTRCFIVEWDESDGSRWIATVHVTADWQGYALAPEDFSFWPDPPIRGRGGPGDRFNPAHAARLSVGVDTAHCGAVAGPQQVEVRSFGTAPADPGLAALASIPRLTGLWPLASDDADETFILSSAVTIAPPTGLGLALDLPPLHDVIGAVASVSRPRGLGTPGSVVPPERFVPLLTATAPDGTWRGTAGAAILHGSGAGAGAAWVTLGLPGDMLGQQAQYAAAFAAQAAAAVLDGARLWYGGAPAAVTAGQPLQLAFRLLPGRAEAVPTFTLDGATVSPGDAAPAAPGIHTLTVQAGGDRIVQPVRVCASPPRRRQGPVSVAGGELMADGAPWRPVGVNYWPRSTSGLAADLYTAGWLTPGLYEPDVVEADLAALERAGCNYVAGVQYTRAEQAPALRDFLARCDAHGIRSSVYLSGGQPLAPDPAGLQALIRTADLAPDTAACAYELAWEPHLGTAGARAPLASAWQRWVADQYGSLARAQQVWGYNGGASGPEDDQLTHDGPWAKMVAAYRRFIDDAVTAGYGRVWSAVRDLADTHLLCARTGYGGTGQMSVVTQMPLDLASGALYLDVICPEGWGLGANTAAAAGMTTAYGRAVSAGKPVVWIEFGTNIWSDPSSGRAAQGAVYQAVGTMVATSRANGLAGWWFPGGLRVNEGSDFGVFDPDGGPRPAAAALAELAAGLRGHPAAAAAPDVWIDVDRDAHVQGYAGVWAAGTASYSAQVRAGHFPGVRLPGAGTTSADTPLTALGGGAYPGYGPLQTLNGTFARVVAGALTVADGDPVAAPVVLQVIAGNTAPARWGPDVHLVADLPDGRTVRAAAAADTPFLGFAHFAPIALPGIAGEVRIQLEARDGIRFGQVFRIQATA